MKCVPEFNCSDMSLKEDFEELLPADGEILLEDSGFLDFEVLSARISLSSCCLKTDKYIMLASYSAFKNFVPASKFSNFEDSQNNFRPKN